MEVINEVDLYTSKYGMLFSVGKLIFTSNSYLKSKGFGPLTFLPTCYHLPEHCHSLSGKASSLRIKSEERPGHLAMCCSIWEFFMSHFAGAYCYTAN